MDDKSILKAEALLKLREEAEGQIRKLQRCGITNEAYVIWSIYEEHDIMNKKMKGFGGTMQTNVDVFRDMMLDFLQCRIAIMDSQLRELMQVAEPRAAGIRRFLSWFRW